MGGVVTVVVGTTRTTHTHPHPHPHSYIQLLPPHLPPPSSFFTSKYATSPRPLPAGGKSSRATTTAARTGGVLVGVCVMACSICSGVVCVAGV